MLTIADDLIILAVGLKSRLGPNTGQLPIPYFSHAMRGAELVALASAGRVEVDGPLIRVRDTTPLGDPGLDAALAAAIPTVANLGASSTAPGVDVRMWMAASPHGFVTARFERLAEAGLLRGERYMLLLIAPRTAYRLANETAARRFEQLRARLHAAVTATGPLDTDQVALAGLLHVARIAHFAYPGKAGFQARQRIKSLAEQAGVVADPGPRDAVPNSGVDPNLLYPAAPWSPQHDPGHWTAPQPVQPAAAAAISHAVQAAVAVSVSAAVAAAVDSATHHYHSSGDSGWSDSGSSHSHH